MVFLAVEFAIVSAFSLCTEVVSGLRATMMSGFFAAAGIGRVVGTLVVGIRVSGVVSALVSGLGLVSLAGGLRGWEPKLGDEKGKSHL